jgi:zinc/manganese transport system substrate-binding protein
VASIGAADLVVANGLGLEEGLNDLIDAAAEEGTHVLRLAEWVDPLPADGSGEPTAGDPHFWHDPDRVALAIGVLTDELTALDDSVDWAGQADGYRAEVTEAGAEADEILAAVPEGQRSLVTNHDSLDYFADRFGFEVIATVIPGADTLAEPGGREIAAMIDTLDRAGVPVIFADTANSTDLAETVAAEAGQPVAVVEVFTDSLGGPGSGAETYVGMIRTNARLVAEALAAP